MDLLAVAAGSGIRPWCLAAIALFLQLFIRFRILNGASLLETRFFGYTPGQARDLLANLGASGRSWYLALQFIDLLFIVSFAAAMVQVDRWSIARMGGNGDPARWVIWLPIAYAVVDVAEDLAIILIVVFPAWLGALSPVAAPITKAKAIFLIASLIATGAVAALSFAPPGRSLRQLEAMNARFCSLVPTLICSLFIG